jgi:hypothetical protein
MHEKMLMLLVFLYIVASFPQKKVILRLTGRLIIIKIGPSFLALCQWPVAHWVAPCAYHLRVVACVIGHVPFTVREKPQRNPSADGYLCAENPQTERRGLRYEHAIAK